MGEMRRFSAPASIASMLFLIAGSVAATADPEALPPPPRDAHLDAHGAIKIEAVRLQVGPATLTLHSGVLVPTSAASEASPGRRPDAVEMVFIGRGSVELEPPDAIEAGQLELFTGAPRLRESFREAVLVIPNDDARAALAERAPARPADITLARAEARWKAWRDAVERRLLGVESALLLDALGDSAFDTDYFAAWFDGEKLGRFLLLIDPEDDEQLTLGQFVPLDAGERATRRLARLLHKEQKRGGRLIGLEADRLGTWDTWVSMPSRLSPDAGRAAVEPIRYVLDVTADPRSRALRVRARLELEAREDGRRGVRVELHPDLAVEAIRDGRGRPLTWLRPEGGGRAAERILVILAEPTTAGAPLTLEIDYGGRFFDGAGTARALRDALLWSPHTGRVDRASYDVTVRWPRKLEMVAGGRRVEGGEDGNLRWERRVVEQPTLGFGFEIGRFEIRTLLTDHITVRAAFDRQIRELSPGTLDEIPAAVADAMGFFESLYGPYPLDEITVVTVPRSYSQAMLGFITLSNAMAADRGLLGLLLGFEDRRTVIAHEVAHQWWGHGIGWASYRDQWISEAMASYSALLWSRQRFGGLLSLAGPTTGWQETLTAPLDDGRPLESIGPLVLGERLVSSRSADAYRAIVYRKGAVVLDMLSKRFGEAGFLRALAHISRAGAGRVLSTEGFFKLLEELTGSDLERFTERFVYGTGLPEVYYTYAFEPADGGEWTVRIEARQEIPRRVRHAARRDADGRWEIVREALEPPDTAAAEFVVPFRIVLAEPDPAGARRALEGRMLLDAPRSSAEIASPGRPARVVLDPEQEIYGQFLDTTRWPKSGLFRQGRDLAVAGEALAAEVLLERALDAEMAPADELPEDTRRDLEARLETRIHLELARVRLALSRDADAAASLRRAEQLAPPSERDWLAAQAALLEARLALRRGDAETAFEDLQKARKRHSLTDAEGWLLLAVAARELGREGEMLQAAETARGLGADVSRLIDEEWVE